MCERYNIELRGGFTDNPTSVVCRRWNIMNIVENTPTTLAFIKPIRSIITYDDAAGRALSGIC